MKFVGNGHTISNVNITCGDTTSDYNAVQAYGLFQMVHAFGNSSLEVSDLTIKSAKIDATKNLDVDSNGSGIIAGYIDNQNVVVLKNVNVIDSSVQNTLVNNTNNGNKAGAFIGYVACNVNVTMTNCESKGCSVAGRNEEYTGAYIGYVNENSKVTLTNCKTDLSINKVGTINTGATVTEK